MPIIRPEQDGAQRCGETPAAHTSPDAHAVTASVELRFHKYRPGLDRTELKQSLFECGVAILIPTSCVSHDVTLADRVIRKLTTQREGHDSSVEPEPPLALDVRIDLEDESDAVAQRVPDRGIHRVLDTRV